MDDSAILAISVAAMLVTGFIGHRTGYNAGHDAGYKKARRDREVYDAIDRNKWAKLEEEE